MLNGAANKELLNGSSYVKRVRVENIFEQASKSRLICVLAGAGYGKTQAVRQYIEKYPDALIRWAQLTESDNNSSRFIDSIAHSVSHDNKEFAEKLLELGFPQSSSEFKKFEEIVDEAEHRSKKTFIVFDDFHHIHSEQILTFIKRCLNILSSHMCMIIISRAEPDIDLPSLLSKGWAKVIAEDDLRFTQDELETLLKENGNVVSANVLPKLMETTNGWALAIQILSLVLQRIPSNLNKALEIMKQNIFTLFETEVFCKFSKRVKKSLVRLSLISNLPLFPTEGFFEDPPFTSITQLYSFISYDRLTDSYRIHPLYLEFLQTKTEILTVKEKKDTFLLAADWCSLNNFYTDAIFYYFKAAEYNRVLEVFNSFSSKLSFDACEYIYGVLSELEDKNNDHENLDALILKNIITPILLLWMDDFERSKEYIHHVIKEWEQSSSQFALSILYLSYSLLAYVNMYTCTATHKYDYARYLKKAHEYFILLSTPSAKPYGPLSLPDLRSFACLVGEGANLIDFEKFIETAEQSVHIVNEVFDNLYSGYEDLVACEIAFFKNQIDISKKYANLSITKARKSNNYNIEAMAVQYLLRIALLEGDYQMIKQLLTKQQKDSKNPDSWGRKMLEDFFTGMFYAQVGPAKTTPPWIFYDENEVTANTRIPMRELLVNVKYYLAVKKYDEVLALTSSSYPKQPEERFVFGELTLSLLTAAAKLKTNDITGALDDFKRAYTLSYDGVFEMPFIERGKDLRPLVTVALKNEDCSIPKEWLKVINRKASIYAKKNTVVLNAFKRERNIEDTINLSVREKEVLVDIYHGLSREEIADNRYLSINTVHKIIGSIFIKLNASNSVDAIRIAIDKNILDIQ